MDNGNVTDAVFHIAAGMVCTKEMKVEYFDKNGDDVDFDSPNIKTENYYITFGRNGHGLQSDYLKCIAEMFARIEAIPNVDFSIQDYRFDNLDDVGYIEFNVFFN